MTVACANSLYLWFFWFYKMVSLQLAKVEVSWASPNNNNAQKETYSVAVWSLYVVQFICISSSPRLQHFYLIYFAVLIPIFHNSSISL